MAPAGLKRIEAAKKDGSWTTLDATEALKMPTDLKKALRANGSALRNFEAFPPGMRKQIIGWVLGARTDGTRNRRIALSAEMAGKGLRANQPNRTQR